MDKSQRFWRSLFFILMVAALCGGLALPVVEGVPVHAAPQRQVVAHLVISQVYGGGGNTDAPFTNDFVEIFNPSDTPISLAGWSIQYASATGTSWKVVALTDLVSGSLAPGQYYLVQLDSGGSTGSPLPTPDVIDSTAIAVGAGKVALVNTTTALSGSGCPLPGSVVDFVGYGATNCSEKVPVPALGNKIAALRNGNGCYDRDNNKADFVRGAPSPRNSASALVVCSAAFTATAAEAANQTGTASAVDATGTAAFLTNAPLIRSIIINEVAWGGTANSSNDEWIELYNPSATNTVDLSGWSLRAADGYPEISIPTGGGYTIGPRGYFLLERGSDDVVMDVKAGWVYPSTVAGVANIMSNGTDEILRLRDPEKRIIDTANSNGYTWPAGTGASTYYSMERRGTMKDTNVAWMTNNKASTWTKHNAKCTSSPPSSCPTSTLIHGTPGYANWARTAIPTPSRTPSLTPTKYRTRTPTLPPPPPLLGINEFVPRPGHDWNHDGVVNTGDEYIELINFGVVDVTLNNYSLDDEVNVGSEPYRLPAGTLKPGERIVLYGSETNLQLSDGGDAVRLLKSNGQLADAYNYSVVRFPDESFCRLPDNGGLDDWNQFCFPTPGLPNSAGQSSVSPPTTGDNESLCPIADTLPQDFAFAECQPFGNNIWNSEYWDRDGWFDGQYLPGSPGKWPLFGD